MKIYLKLLNIASIIVIVLMSISPAAAWVSVAVDNSTINFGNVTAGTTVSTSSTINVNGNENLDFYVRTNGPLTDAAGNIIPNNPNFKFRIQYPQQYIDSGYVTLSNINQQKVVSNWPKPNKQGADIATETYSLMVPDDTLPGTYTTTVIFTVISGGVTPTGLVTAPVTNSINHTTSNSSNISDLNTIRIISV